jgi:hypothetical protein
MDTPAKIADIEKTPERKTELDSRCSLGAEGGGIAQ